MLLIALLAARVVSAAPVLDLRLTYLSQVLGEIDPCG